MTYHFNDDFDDGTMPNNVKALAEAIVGHRIVNVERRVEKDYAWNLGVGTRLTLDNGSSVFLADTDDCCAYTALKDVIEYLPSIDHTITNVTTNYDYSIWHILADFGEVMEFKVGWSPGNSFYYSYGFNITVEEKS